MKRKERSAKIGMEAAQVDKFVNQVDKPFKFPETQPLDTKAGT